MGYGGKPHPGGHKLLTKGIEAFPAINPVFVFGTDHARTRAEATLNRLADLYDV
jgi:hypothetical protein